MKNKKKNIKVLVILAVLFAIAFFIVPLMRNIIARTGFALSSPEFPKHSEISPLSIFDFKGSIKNLDGTITLLSDFRGKVIFLNFWATWCPPCRSEMPSIQKLYNKIKGNKDVKIILVSIEEPETVKNYLSKNKFTMPVYISDKSLPAKFNVRGIPASFILNAKGHIVFKHIGSARWDDKKSVNFIKGLI